MQPEAHFAAQRRQGEVDDLPDAAQRGVARERVSSS